jgi:broad specificity phosphatase PhoE
MNLYIVRHGQSLNNTGESNFHNVPLTPLGHKQIRRTAKVLSNEKFDALYCSPLERALQTATILYRKLGIAPYVHPDFSETGFSGGEPDVSREQMQSSYPHAILDQGITSDGWAPKGETSEEAYERACRITKWLIERHPNSDANLLVVSHGHYGSIFIGSLVGLRPDGCTHFSQYNGCISRVDMIDGQWKLRFLNRTSHLPDIMLT